MDLLPNAEQQEIIEATASFVNGELPLSRLHDSEVPVPIGQPLWQSMAELGWFGLGLSEEAGGIGFTIAEEALVFRELGRVLAPSNMLAAAIAARVAVHAGNAELAGEIIAGEKRVAFAEAADVTARAGATVDGSFRRVDASDVELLLCSTADGFAVIAADALEAGEVVPCIDEHTHLARTTAHGIPALAHASGDDDALRNRAAVLAAAMLAGGAEATRDQAAAYACERHQFGKPIGVFQAVKHKCSDMAVRCEAATWQTLYAALCVRDGLPHASLQASAAKALAGEAATENGRMNIMVHGGYGVTSEYDAHLFLKRGHVLDMLVGGGAEHLTRVLAQPAAA